MAGRKGELFAVLGVCPQQHGAHCPDGGAVQGNIDDVDIINQERVLVNFECETKKTKIIKPNDMITIRGKGRFFVKEFVGQTRSGRDVVKVEKFV